MSDLKIQNISNEIIEEINVIVYEFMSELSTDVYLDDSFFDPIKFNSFTEKNIKMREFKERIDALISDSNNE